MAGHSQFKNIMHRKGAQDAKRAKVFTKIIRELTVAARTGLPDPAQNPRLRAAVTAARAANMPKDTMERAVRRGTGEDGGAEPRVLRRVGQPRAGRHCQLADDLGEHLGPLGVLRALAVHDVLEL